MLNKEGYLKALFQVVEYELMEQLSAVDGKSSPVLVEEFLDTRTNMPMSCELFTKLTLEQQEWISTVQLKIEKKIVDVLKSRGDKIVIKYIDNQGNEQGEENVV